MWREDLDRVSFWTSGDALNISVVSGVTRDVPHWINLATLQNPMGIQKGSRPDPDSQGQSDGCANSKEWTGTNKNKQKCNFISNSWNTFKTLASTQARVSVQSLERSAPAIYLFWCSLDAISHSVKRIAPCPARRQHWKATVIPKERKSKLKFDTWPSKTTQSAAVRTASTWLTAPATLMVKL